MDDLVFEDPPAWRKTNPAYEAVAEALRKRPREWARVGAWPSAYMMASNIKRGRPKVFEPAGSFDAVARKVGDETFLYVQYIGEAKDSEEPS